ncbi:hypothetical protein ACJ41O_003694 [Fusarium nematophilum]
MPRKLRSSVRKSESPAPPLPSEAGTTKKRSSSAMESPVQPAARPARRSKAQERDGAPEDGAQDQAVEPGRPVGDPHDSIKSPSAGSIARKSSPIKVEEPQPTTEPPSANRDVKDPALHTQYPSTAWGRVDFCDPPGLLSVIETKRWNHEAFQNMYSMDHIRDLMWEDLDINISRFAGACLPGTPVSWEGLDAETQDRIKRWAPAARAYFEDVVTTKVVMKSWVWRIIFDNLFSPNCRDKWLGQHWADFDNLRRSLQENVTNEEKGFVHAFHDWRYLTARMLYATKGPHSDADRLKKILVTELDPVIKLRNQEAEIVDEYLAIVVDKAMEMDLRLLAQKANVSVEMHDPATGKLWGFPYKHDPAIMISAPDYRTHRKSLEGFRVDFISSPRMISHGERRSLKELSWYRYDSSEPYQYGYDKGRFMPMRVVVDQFPEKDENSVKKEEAESSR